LAQTYGWLPQQSEDLEWADAVRFVEKANERIIQRQEEKVFDYMTLIGIIHSEKPGKLIEQFRGILEPEKAIDDEVGDLTKLKQLAAKRGS
jgi:hypothetical protein